MRQPVLLFILKGKMDCTETADGRLGNSVQLTLTGYCTFPGLESCIGDNVLTEDSGGPTSTAVDTALVRVFTDDSLLGS